MENKLTPQQALQALYELAVHSKKTVAADMPTINNLAKVIEDALKPKEEKEEK